MSRKLVGNTKSKNVTFKAMDVIAKSFCICYSMSITSLENILGTNFKSVLYVNYIKMAMRQSKLFSKINGSFIESAFKLFKIIKYEKNKSLCTGLYRKYQ